jgi:hypothetical protein
VHRLLTPTDLAVAELCAARLDGEVYAVDGCYASVAVPDDAVTRATAFAWAVDGGRLVAERLSAAWIWGVRSRAPSVHHACARPHGRARPQRGRAEVRETSLGTREVVRVGPARVTVPTRTVVDLLRASERWGPEERDAVRGLAPLVDLDAVRGTLVDAHRAPHSRRALRRWTEVVAVAAAPPLSPR